MFWGGLTVSAVPAGKMEAKVRSWRPPSSLSSAPCSRSLDPSLCSFRTVPELALLCATGISSALLTGFLQPPVFLDFRLCYPVTLDRFWLCPRRSGWQRKMASRHRHHHVLVCSLFRLGHETQRAHVPADQNSQLFRSSGPSSIRGRGAGVRVC